MIIYPAIDLRGGKCVRLFQGKADQETVYFENPVEPAKTWRDGGASNLHVVDLDGAFSGNSRNLDAVQEILKVDGLKVQLGGGMRDEKVIKQSLDMGLSRVIIGTRACNEPSWVIEMIKQFGPDRIVVGIDAKDGMVATQGWVETSTTPAKDLAKALVANGLRWIIHTDVSTDGAMQGPNLEAQREISLAVPKCNVIASGGVSCAEDISNLRKLSIECPNIEGVIVGKALYEKTVDLKQVIKI
jgi:phosphoribosylformimino-5-aminoimidazole carboxamide ribotide isomerase